MCSRFLCPNVLLDFNVSVPRGQWRLIKKIVPLLQKSRKTFLTRSNVQLPLTDGNVFNYSNILALVTYFNNFYFNNWSLYFLKRILLTWDFCVYHVYLNNLIRIHLHTRNEARLKSDTGNRINVSNFAYFLLIFKLKMSNCARSLNHCSLVMFQMNTHFTALIND